TEFELLCCASQLAAGLSALHEAGIIHRDIAARNIFLSEAADKSGAIVLKIGDFGQAKYIGDQKTSSDMADRVELAPEIKSGQEHDKRSDVYSLGVVLCELMM